MNQAEQKQQLIEKIREIGHPEASLLFFRLLKDVLDVTNLADSDPRLAIVVLKNAVGISVNINVYLALRLTKNRSEGVRLWFAFPKEYFEGGAHPLAQSKDFQSRLNGPQARLRMVAAAFRSRPISTAMTPTPSSSGRTACWNLWKKPDAVRTSKSTTPPLTKPLSTNLTGAR